MVFLNGHVKVGMSRDVIFPKPVTECPEADPKALGRPGTIVVTDVECVQDKCHFHLFYGCTRRCEIPCLNSFHGVDKIEMLRKHGIAISDQDGPFNNIFQFTYIARPWVGHQIFKGGGCRFCHPTIVDQTVFFQEKSDQEGYIFFSFPQRGQCHGQDIQSVEQVFPEAVRLDGLDKILVTDGDNTHIDGPGCCPPTRSISRS